MRISISTIILASYLLTALKQPFYPLCVCADGSEERNIYSQDSSRPIIYLSTIRTYLHFHNCSGEAS